MKKTTHSFNFQKTILSNALEMSANMVSSLNPETMSSVELQKFCKLLNAIDKVREDVVFLAGAESVMWQVNKKIENGELDVL
jgi:cellulose biosynthesis protein BcsQ